MTAHQRLHQLQRPYTIAAWTSASIFLVAGVTMLLSKVGRIADAGSDPTEVFIIGGIYLASALFLVASTVLPLLRIRCPYCQVRLGGKWKRWQHCPYCAANLHTDMQTLEATQNG